MEAGYNSIRYSSSEPHASGDEVLSQVAPFVSSPYEYNSPLVLKPRNNPREGMNFQEHLAEDSLAQKLNILTAALNQGKPIRVDDLMSLKTSNEVCLFLILFYFLILKNFHRNFIIIQTLYFIFQKKNK